MGCGTSRTWENVEAAADLEQSPTIWVGNIPSGFGHINSFGLCVVNDLKEDDLISAFSEYGEVVTVSLRKKGGEFDTKNWALVTFSEPEAAGRALFSETVVVDEAFDEVQLKVKPAAIDEKLGGKGALGNIAKQQNERVRKVEARKDRIEREEQLEVQRTAARSKRQEKKKQQAVDPEADEKLAAVRRKFAEAKTADDSGEPGAKPRRRRASTKTYESRERRNSAMDASFRERKVKPVRDANKAGKKKKKPVQMGDGGAAAAMRRSSGGKGARYQPVERDEEAASEVDIDRTTMWCTTWVGGIPAEFVKSNAEMKVLRLFKKFGSVVRVTVRKKKNDGNTYKSWAFVTFKEARSVAAAMRSEVKLPDYKCTLQVEPAAVSTELEKNEEGALKRMWEEQQNKVLHDPEAKQQMQQQLAGARSDFGTENVSAPSGPRSRNRRGSVLGTKYVPSNAGLEGL